MFKAAGTEYNKYRKSSQLEKRNWSFDRQRGVAIGKPERQVRKVSHCGSKQQ